MYVSIYIYIQTDLYTYIYICNCIYLYIYTVSVRVTGNGELLGTWLDWGIVFMLQGLCPSFLHVFASIET